MSNFIAKKFDRVTLVYNQFKNAATQITIHEQFLPIQNANKQEKSVGDYLFEPAKADIVHKLIPKSLKTQLFKAVLDSHASEHGARMTAMHKLSLIHI